MWYCSEKSIHAKQINNSIYIYIYFNRFCNVFALYLPVKNHNYFNKNKPDWLRRVWRYQRGNQNPYIEEEQTTQWSKEKVQKDKQQSTKHTHKAKDLVTQTPIKTGGELRWSGRVFSSCSTSGTLRFNLVTNPVINHEWEKNLEVLMTSGTYPWSFMDIP